VVISAVFFGVPEVRKVEDMIHDTLLKDKFRSI